MYRTVNTARFKTSPYCSFVELLIGINLDFHGDVSADVYA